MKLTDAILSGVAWKQEPQQESDNGLPCVTHSGIVNLFGRDMRCYRLTDGKAVIDADDMNALLAEMGV